MNNTTVSSSLDGGIPSICYVEKTLDQILENNDRLRDGLFSEIEADLLLSRILVLHALIISSPVYRDARIKFARKISGLLEGIVTIAHRFDWTPETLSCSRFARSHCTAVYVQKHSVSSPSADTAYARPSGNELHTQARSVETNTSP